MFPHGQSFINRCIVGWCPTTIRVTGEHCMRIAELDVERWGPGKGGCKSNWYDFVADLVDPKDVAYGEIVYRTVIANVGYLPKAFEVESGGTRVHIHEIYTP